MLNRNRVVKIQNGRSHPRVVPCGVPHGSILGPILLLIHINYLSDMQFRGEFYSFADDVTIVHSATTQKLLLANIICDLKLIISWYYKNELYNNGKKTELIIFGCKNTENFVDKITLSARL